MPTPTSLIEERINIMKQRKTLILTIGLPRSGKSTWAIEQNCPIVNPDSIHLALHGNAFIQDAEDFVWVIAYTMTRALFLAGHNKVIIDATNNTEKRRKVWHDKFDSEACGVIYKFFNTNIDICIQRAIEAKREDLIPIIIRMNEQKDW